MPTLLEIGEQAIVLRQLLEEAAENSVGGELSDEQAAAFDVWFAELETDKAKKLDCYAALIREWELRASVRQAEIDRLKIRVQVDEAQANRLRHRLKEWMIAHGEKKIETDRFCVSWRNNGGVQPLEMAPDLDPRKLPAELQRVTITPDNGKIREVLAAGGEVAGCRLLPRGTTLTIK